MLLLYPMKRPLGLQLTNSLTTTVNNNTANISTNATAIFNETSARGTAISNLSAIVDAKNQTLLVHLLLLP